MRCRCWLIMCRAGRGWCWRGGPSRRCGWRGCGRRAGSWRSAPGSLMLSRAEAASLLRAAGVVLGEDEVAVLHERTEGWPAGLSLAALSLREGGPAGTAAVSFGGADRLVSRVPGGGVPGPDLPAAPGVPDPDRGAGADERAAVRGGAGSARLGRDAGRAGPVRPAAGAAGPARPVVPLPPPVPRHAAGRAGTPGARPDPGPAPPRGPLVPAPRPARGSTGILHRRRTTWTRPLAW